MTNPFETALDESAKLTINLAAKLTGMAPEKVAEVLADGIPKAMAEVKADPAAATQAVKQAFEAIPEPVHRIYERLGSAAAAPGATIEDFRSMFGSSATSLAETTSSLAGASKEQADKVLGAALPAVKDAMRAGAAAAGAAADSIDASKAQDLLSQAQEATAKVFGRLAGR
jgi:hypothetical protein